MLRFLTSLFRKPEIPNIEFQFEPLINEDDTTHRRFLMIAQYYQSKIPIPKGRDFAWIMRAYPTYYHADIKVGLLTGRKLPPVEQIKELADTGPNTLITRITVFELDSFELKRPQKTK